MRTRTRKAPPTTVGEIPVARGGNCGVWGVNLLCGFCLGWLEGVNCGCTAGKLGGWLSRTSQLFGPSKSTSHFFANPDKQRRGLFPLVAMTTQLCWGFPTAFLAPHHCRFVSPRSNLRATPDLSQNNSQNTRRRGTSWKPSLKGGHHCEIHPCEPRSRNQWSM